MKAVICTSRSWTHLNCIGLGSLLAVLPALLCAVEARANPVTLFAGDTDNFGAWNDFPADNIALEPGFASWFAPANWPHGGYPQPFDMDTDAEAQACADINDPNGSWPSHNHYENWSFGYSFDISQYVPISSAEVTIRLKPAGYDHPDNDTLSFGFNGAGFVQSMNLSDWGWAAGGPPMTLTTNFGGNFVNFFNSRGWVDVSVQDDTAVDWISLTIESVPEPASAGLFALGAMALGRRRH